MNSHNMVLAQNIDKNIPGYHENIHLSGREYLIGHILVSQELYAKRYVGT